MIKREFQAQIISDDFKKAWLMAVAKDESFSYEEAMNAYGGKDLDKLSARISGSIVTITYNTYVIGSGDYFEKEDNNFVMYDELFTELAVIDKPS